MRQGKRGKGKGGADTLEREGLDDAYSLGRRGEGKKRGKGSWSLPECLILLRGEKKGGNESALFLCRNT